MRRTLLLAMPVFVLGGSIFTSCGESADQTGGDANPADQEGGGAGHQEGGAEHLEGGAGPEACAPVPCPSGAPWDPVQCGCLPPHDAALEGAQEADATTDAVSEACGAASCATDAPHDASAPTDGPGTCTESIDTYCAAEGGVDSPCVRTWSAAQQASPWCRSATDRVFVRANCDGYDLIVQAGVDTYQAYYYDLNTHALVRVEHAGGIGPKCYAGVPGVVAAWATCSDAALSSICGRDAAN